MKKLLFIIITLLSICLLWEGYQQHQIKTIQKLQSSAPLTDNDSFYIPDVPILNNPEVMYPCLVEAAKKSKSNLFRTSIQYNEKDNFKISKYILIINSTHFWKSIQMKSGRNLTAKETQDNKNFLSSVNTVSKNQKGILSTFGNSYEVEIYPFENIVQSLPVNGTYFVELSSGLTKEEFLMCLVNEINNKATLTNEMIDIKEFENQEMQISYNNTYEPCIVYIIVSVILCVLLVYFVMMQTTKIGIMKLHGFSNYCIWYCCVGRFIIKSIFFATSITLVTVGIISYIYCDDQFFIYVATRQMILSILIVLSSGISLWIINRIPLYRTVKKQNQKSVLICMNTLIKICVAICIMLMGVKASSDFKEFYLKQNTIKSWEKSNEYGMFYPFYVGEAQTSEERFHTDELINKELYPELNRLGSIYINARSYETMALKYGKSTLRYISVNPNYLDVFPVYDENGEIISANEEDNRYLLIVPEQYKGREKEIKNFFKEEKEWRIEIDEDVYHVTVSEQLKNDNVSIIWSQKNQSIFSFNPDVFPQKGNNIKDPIIRVITEENSLAVERESILGGGVTDPLKVKLIDKDYKKTYQLLSPVIKQLNLQNNLKHLVAINEVMQSQLSELQKIIKQKLCLILLLLIMELELLVQSQTIFFEKNKQLFLVRKMLGWSFGRTYFKLVLYLFGVWITQLVGSWCIVKILNVSTDFLLVLILAVIMLVLESGLAGIVLNYLEWKSKANIRQGE